MPDTYGKIYEAVIYHCLERLGVDPVVPDPKDASLTCRSSCPHSAHCKTTGKKPELFIHPDLGVRSKCGLAAVYYVTHWRNADNFQYKVWRTIAELFEHKVHILNIRAINWLAEPVGHKEHLLDALRRLMDDSIDYGVQSGISGSTALARSVHSLVGIADSASHKAVADTLAAERKIDTSLDRELAKLEVKTKASLVAPIKNEGPTGIWTVARRNCIQARLNSAKPAAINSSYRSSVQLLAAVASMCGGKERDVLNKLTKDNDFVRAGLPQDAISLVKSLVFRKRKAEAVTVGSENVSILRSAVGFPAAVWGNIRKCDPHVLADLAVTYYLSYRKHSTWGPYFEVFAITHDRIAQLREEWPARTGRALRSTIKAVLLGESDRLLFDMLLVAAGTSLNEFQKHVDSRLRPLIGVELKRLSPHGDTGFHVFRAMLTGNAEKVRPAPGKGQRETVQIIAKATADEYIDNWMMKSQAWDIEPLVLSARSQKMRTYLSKAPNPITAHVARHLSSGKWQRGRLLATVINDMFGGKTGKTEYDFVGTDGLCGVKIVTAQDGNEAHKTKELCGRLRAQQITTKRTMPDLLRCERRDFTAHLVLDGEWAEEQVRALYYAGYESIIPVEEIPTACPLL